MNRDRYTRGVHGTLAVAHSALRETIDMHEMGSPDNWFDSSRLPLTFADERADRQRESDAHRAVGWVRSRFDEPMPPPRTRPMFSGQFPSMRLGDTRQSVHALVLYTVSGAVAVALGFYFSSALVPLFEASNEEASLARRPEAREESPERGRYADGRSGELAVRRSARKPAVMAAKSRRSLGSRQSHKAEPVIPVDPNAEPDLDLMNIPSSPMEQRALVERGRTPVTNDQLPAGPGRERNVEALNKLDTLIHDPGGETGTVHINSRPWAHVFIDGRSVGTTPVLKQPVTVGQHTVLLVNNIFGMNKTLEVSVSAGEHVTRVVSLDNDK